MSQSVFAEERSKSRVEMLDVVEVMDSEDELPRSTASSSHDVITQKKPETHSFVCVMPESVTMVMESETEPEDGVLRANDQLALKEFRQMRHQAEAVEVAHGAALEAKEAVPAAAGEAVMRPKLRWRRLSLKHTEQAVRQEQEQRDPNIMGAEAEVGSVWTKTEKRRASDTRKRNESDEEAKASIKALARQLHLEWTLGLNPRE